jgi:hypothetical protein
MDLEEYMTVSEAAKKLKKSVPMISHLCRGGQLFGAVKLTTGAWLIPIESVNSYTPGKRGPRTNKEKLADDLAGIQTAVAETKKAEGQ